MTSTVVSFSYRSRPWERAAIPQAADDLKTWLDTELQANRHLVFVTHGSGGPILDAYHDPELAIRALHYLCYLVLARKHGVHVFELSQELPQLLKPAGAFEKVVESFTLVPEVLELYRECQVIHAALDAGAR